jgi:hypothetical protein
MLPITAQTRSERLRKGRTSGGAGEIESAAESAESVTAGMVGEPRQVCHVTRSLLAFFKCERG